MHQGAGCKEGREGVTGVQGRQGFSSQLGPCTRVQDARRGGRV